MRLQGPEKMKIDHKGVTYEGVPAANAIGMAIFESTGMRGLIDTLCTYDPARRILSPGMVVKALIGPTFNVGKKYPLYMVNTAYSSAPTDRLFGPGVSAGQLYDTALARGLDCAFDADLTAMFAECSDLAVAGSGFGSRLFHMDSTDISFYGVEHPPDKEGAASPKHNGHPKDLRVELLQYELQIVADSDRLIRYMRPYSGNVADCVMDLDAIEAFGGMYPESERRTMTFVGDCKLATAGNIARMIDLGFGFVTKCAEDFKDGGKRKAVERALGSRMRSCGNGLWMSGSRIDIDLGDGRTEELRFVVFRRDSDVQTIAEGIRSSALAKAESVIRRMKGMRFPSEDEALDAVRDLGPDPEGPLAFGVRTVLYRSQDPGNAPGWWELDLTPVLDERSVRLAAERKAAVVLVTNLSDGTSDEKVMAIYNQEYKVESAFRLMKSGMGMNSVYLQTPSRENAMMFVISIAVLVSNIADAMFRRAGMMLDGKPLTMYRLAFWMQTTNVMFSRSDNRLYLQGPAEVTERFFEITDALGINPQLLLGYIDD